MKKSFKKTLSSVLALALSLSCFSAISVSADASIVEWDATSVTKNANLMTVAMLQNNMAGSTQGASGAYSSDKSECVYSLSGAVSQDVNRLYAGFRFNTGGEFFAPVAGTTYVFDMKVKNASTNGATPGFGVGMSDNNGSSRVDAFSNEYGEAGMTLTDSENWMDFKTTLTLPANYNTTASASYAQRVWMGFRNGTGESGWAVAIKTDSLDDFYFSTEQIYDITNTITSDTIVAVGEDLTAEACVLNQIGLAGGLSQDIDWYVYDEAKTTDKSSGFTITPSGNSVTVTGTSAQAGNYYLVAAAPNGDATMYRSAAFTLEPADAYTEWDASSVTKNANLITSYTAGDVNGYGRTTGTDGDIDYILVSGTPNVSNPERLFCGQRLTNTGLEDGTTYVISMKVKNGSTDGTTPLFNIGLNGSSLANAIWPNEYQDSSAGLTLSDTWQDYKATITTTDTFNTTHSSRKTNVWFGIPKDLATATTGFCFDVTGFGTENPIYMAKEQIYDITNTITSDTTFKAGETLTANAYVLNQIGLTGALSQDITWQIFDEEKLTDVTSSFTVTSGANTVSVGVPKSTAGGTYYLVASAPNGDTTMYRSAQFTLLESIDYSDSALPAKNANMIPDASDNYGVTYFAQRTNGDKFGYGWCKTDDEIEGYHAEFTYTGDGTLDEAWRMAEGIVLNHGSANFGYTPEAGKTYVFSANVKNISPEGVYPALNLATNSTYSPNWGIVSNEYPDGYTLSSGWEKFNASFTITDEFLTDRGYPDVYPTEYKDKPVFGFVPGTATNAAFRLDVSTKDAVYFAEEQTYTINFTADGANIATGDSINVTAMLVNQVGTTGSLSQEFEWVILDSTRENVISDIAVSKSGSTATITPADTVDEGEYVALAISDAGIQKGYVFTVSAPQVETVISEVNLDAYEGDGYAWDVTINGYDSTKTYSAYFTSGSESKKQVINGVSSLESEGSVAFAIFLHSSRANVALDIIKE